MNVEEEYDVETSSYSLFFLYLLRSQLSFLFVTYLRVYSFTSPLFDKLVGEDLSSYILIKPNNTLCLLLMLLIFSSLSSWLMQIYEEEEEEEEKEEARERENERRNDD